jgi:hypothetical protein
MDQLRIFRLGTSLERPAAMFEGHSKLMDFIQKGLLRWSLPSVPIADLENECPGPSEIAGMVGVLAET